MTLPLTPPGCDLSDFPFMPLDVARLRDSELASNESPEACWAAVLLWAAAWHQIPAASIPNDDKWMAQQAGYGRVVREWLRVKPGALRGWVECDDSRLYHPVVAEKAREAWQAKLQQRWRTECARIKKHNDRHKTDHPRPTFDEWMSLGCPQGHMLYVPGDKAPDDADKGGDKPSKRQGEGQGQGDSISEANASDAATASASGEDSKPKAKTPEDMAKAELWRAGKALLLENDVPKDQCGTFLGVLVNDYGALLVLDAVRAAVRETPADAREYLKATCQRLKGERAAAPQAVTVPSAGAEKTAAYLAEQARLAAEKSPDGAARAQAAKARVLAAKNATESA